MRERNFRCAHGEIDLVASAGEYVVFVEVKTRSRGTAYHPTLAVTEAKKQRLRTLGQFYCDHHLAQALQPRFDVIAVTLRQAAGPADAPQDGAQDDSGDAEPLVEHYINAF